MHSEALGDPAEMVGALTLAGRGLRLHPRIMPSFHDVAVEIDGHRYTGTWTLKPGGRLCVGCFWGSETVEIGGVDPAVAAVNVLARIVRVHQEGQARDLERKAREMAKRRRRKRGRPTRTSPASN